MSDASFLALAIDRDATGTLVEQICDQIRRRIIDGRIATGTQLPSTRVLAMELGTSRSSIVTAYEQLVAEGCIRSKARSGYLVCDVAPQPMTPQLVAKETPLEQASYQPMRFAPGVPDMRLFPHRAWAAAMARVMRDNRKRLLTERICSVIAICAGRLPPTSRIGAK